MSVEHFYQDIKVMENWYQVRWGYKHDNRLQLEYKSVKGQAY